MDIRQPTSYAQAFISRAGGIGPAALVLSRPVFSQGKAKFHFCKGK